MRAVMAKRGGRFGEKHSCKSCSARFYDLNKPEPRCPKCDTPVARTKPRLNPAEALAKPPSSKTPSQDLEPMPESMPTGVTELDDDELIGPDALDPPDDAPTAG